MKISPTNSGWGRFKQAEGGITRPAYTDRHLHQMLGNTTRIVITARLLGFPARGLTFEEDTNPVAAVFASLTNTPVSTLCLCFSSRTHRTSRVIGHLFTDSPKNNWQARRKYSVHVDAKRVAEDTFTSHSEGPHVAASRCARSFLAGFLPYRWPLYTLVSRRFSLLTECSRLICASFWRCLRLLVRLLR